MENKNTISTGLSVVLSVLSFIMLGYYAMTFFNTKSGSLVDYASCLAYIAALLYCLGGYKKNSAFFYKAFLFCFLLLPAADIITYLSKYLSGEFTYSIAFMMNILNLVFMIPLTFAKDLGKKKSYNYAGVILVLNVVCLVMYILEGANAFTILNLICLIAIRTIVVYAKYQDKTARGTN